eukprot:TRINITY_DN11196_c0_g2_i1.p1 TRINITY_DN11196_c0_g2~~TRINITY_DN11196_c0_g2_i1.p1  ORF type:complete len:167 (-),score=1.60 TRINITY_DN11196_c0_g2_i1:30-530(-)
MAFSRTRIFVGVCALLLVARCVELQDEDEDDDDDNSLTFEGMTPEESSELVKSINLTSLGIQPEVNYEIMEFNSMEDLYAALDRMGLRGNGNLELLVYDEKGRPVDLSDLDERFGKEAAENYRSGMNAFDDSATGGSVTIDGDVVVDGDFHVTILVCEQFQNGHYE